MTMQSDQCIAFREVGGRTDICRRTRGHVERKDPRRREHYDPSGEHYWMEHGNIRADRVMTGNVFRARCDCGYEGGNGTQSVAERAAALHRRDAERFADVNGLILTPGDKVRAHLTSFDGPIHLASMEMIVVKTGRTKVVVTTAEHNGYSWGVTASTLTRTGTGAVLTS